ncbi:MAG: DUF2007 domain-containing protein [Phenylobacterium sp.]
MELPASPSYLPRMIELIATSDPVQLSFWQAALAAADIEAFVFDAGIPWAGTMPRRLMVAEEDAALARRAIEQAEEAIRR